MDDFGATDGETGDRVSILSVPASRIKPHFWTYSVGLTLHIAYNIYANLTSAENMAWRKLPAAIIADTVPAIGFWLVFGAILAEGINMVLAAMFRHKNRQEGINRGLATADAAWREWNRRRLAAAERGESFDEPPPTFGGDAIQRKN